MLRRIAVRLADKDTKLGVGNLDFLDLESGDEPEMEEMIERWWCNGDDRNRVEMWIQGQRVLRK
jgi:guanine deaminase